MAVNAIPQPRTSHNAARPWLGLVGIAGAPFLLLSFLAEGAKVQNRAGELFGLLFIGSSMFSVWALKDLRATGRGIGQALLWLELALLSGATLWSLAMTIAPNSGQGSAIVGLGDACWPLSMLSMLVTGITVAVLGGLTGWRRWIPMLCGLALPLAFASAVISKGLSLYVFGGYACILWAALGLAVRTEPTK